MKYLILFIVTFILNYVIISGLAAIFSLNILSPLGIAIGVAIGQTAQTWFNRKYHRERR